MFKKEAKFILFLFLAILSLGFGAAILVPWLTVRDMDKTFRLITRAEFHCPAGTIEAVDRWGKAGYMRFCRKGEVKHGPWMAWEAQYKNIEGEYREGREHGLWTVWNKDGSRYKVIEFRNGVEIREERFTKDRHIFTARKNARVG